MEVNRVQNRELFWQKGITYISFLLIYVFIEWVSNIDPFHNINITPWNPAAALIVFLFLQNGARAASLVFVSMLSAELLIFGYSDNFAAKFLVCILMTFDYLMLASILLRFCPDGGMFNNRENLFAWVIIIALGSIFNGALVATVYSAANTFGGLGNWGFAVLHFFWSDASGMIIGLPLLWHLRDAKRRHAYYAATVKVETLGYLALTFLLIWIAFNESKPTSFGYFFTLFLPIVWASSRQGLCGAILCSVALQLGMVIAEQFGNSVLIELFDVQMRATVFALVGYFIGVVVDTQRRDAEILKQSLRLSAAGEMAAALAHELNQPLSALGTYGAACQKMLSQNADVEALRLAINRMTNEASRAAKIVVRLRDFFRSGSTLMEHFALRDLIESAATSVREQCTDVGIALNVTATPDQMLVADRMQLDLVLRNLLANAVESVAEHTETLREIWVRSERVANGRLCITVEDSGPGIPESIAKNLFEPFTTTKAKGLGLGLAISRAIVEAHGGALVAEAGQHGCFKLYLPLASGHSTHG